MKKYTKQNQCSPFGLFLCTGHLTFCGYACNTCNRQFWPTNDENFCPASMSVSVFF